MNINNTLLFGFGLVCGILGLAVEVTQTGEPIVWLNMAFILVGLMCMGYAIHKEH